MKFEVKRDGITKMQTAEPQCIPSREERDELRKAGYKLYLDGKLFKEQRRT